jgi:hypothetical protein
MGTGRENPSIVSDIAPDTRLRLTFETLVCRLFRDSVGALPGERHPPEGHHKTADRPVGPPGRLHLGVHLT